MIASGFSFHLQIMLHHRGVFFSAILHHSIHLVMISDLILSLYHILSIFSESDRVSGTVKITFPLP